MNHSAYSVASARGIVRVDEVRGFAADLQVGAEDVAAGALVEVEGEARIGVKQRDEAVTDELAGFGVVHARVLGAGARGLQIFFRGSSAASVAAKNRVPAYGLGAP